LNARVTHQFIFNLRQNFSCNWTNKKGCRVELLLKNGDRIIRTRNGTDGHDDLLYVENGIDISLSTNKVQGQALLKKFNLDYITFTGSVFFAQYAKAWLEMSDQVRKQAFEQILHIDRFQLYADIAKAKGAEYATAQEKLRLSITSKESTIQQLESSLVNLRKAEGEFETNRTSKSESAKATLQELVNSAKELTPIDVPALQAEWDKYKQTAAVVETKAKALDGLTAKSYGIQADIKSASDQIKFWKGKIGKCQSCAQPVTTEYVESNYTTGLNDTLTTKQTELQTVTAAISKFSETIAQARSLVEKKKPAQTVEEAKRHNNEVERRQKAVVNQLKNIQTIDKETNHYTKTINDTVTRVDNLKAEIDAVLIDLKVIDETILHHNYIYKAYSDRRKVKRILLAEYIPYLNSRIAHYLTKFELDIKIEFTDGLAVKSNVWDYEFFSGGERKRVDVAMMLAVYDLYTVMYGKQCNVVVLDEVDGRLDKHGARVLSEIIRDEIAEVADAVLVISHRFDMRGAFQSELQVVRSDGFSKIRAIQR
jgi:exonuclease SbcC